MTAILAAKGDGVVCSGHFLPQHTPGFIRIDHGVSVCGQGCKHFTLGPGNPFFIAKTQQVCRTYVANQAHMRRRNLAKIADVTGLAGTHFQYRILVVAIQPKQGQRQT